MVDSNIKAEPSEQLWFSRISGSYLALGCIDLFKPQCYDCGVRSCRCKYFLSIQTRLNQRSTYLGTATGKANQAVSATAAICGYRSQRCARSLFDQHDALPRSSNLFLRSWWLTCQSFLNPYLVSRPQPQSHCSSTHFSLCLEQDLTRPDEAPAYCSRLPFGPCDRLLLQCNRATPESMERIHTLRLRSRPLLPIRYHGRLDRTNQLPLAELARTRFPRMEDCQTNAICRCWGRGEGHNAQGGWRGQTSCRRGDKG